MLLSTLRKILLPLVLTLPAALGACAEARAADPATDARAADEAAAHFLKRPPDTYPNERRRQFGVAAWKLERAVPGDATDWNSTDVEALAEAARVLALFDDEARRVAASVATGAPVAPAPDRAAAEAARAVAARFLKRPPGAYPTAQRRSFGSAAHKLARAEPGDGTDWNAADVDALNVAARVLALFDARAREIAAGVDADGAAPAAVVIEPVAQAETSRPEPEPESEPEPEPEPSPRPDPATPDPAPDTAPEPPSTSVVVEPLAQAPAPDPEPTPAPASDTPETAPEPPSAGASETAPDPLPEAAPEPEAVPESEQGPEPEPEPEPEAEPEPEPAASETADTEDDAESAGNPDDELVTAVALGAANPVGRRSYGNSVASINDVANLTMKRERHALRFDVPAEGFTMDQVLVWWRYNDPGKGSTYSAGDGGTYEVSLQRVGGGGAPDGNAILSFVEVVDTYNRSNRTLSNYQRSTDVERTFLAPGRYALVFENIDPDPRGNYASLNGPIWWDFESVLDDPSQADPAHPGRAALKEFDNGGWGIASPYGDANRTLGAFYMPVWAVRDSARGVSIGQDIHYGEAVTSQTPIEGATKVRQRIVPTGNLDDAQLNLMVGRAAGDGPLVVRVDGDVVAEVAGLPLVPDPEKMHRRGEKHFRWISLAVPDGTVRAGREAVIELESPNGRHRICAGLRNRYYGLKDWDGRAERSVNGGAWTGWRAHGKEDADNVQLCAFFSGDA